MTAILAVFDWLVDHPGPTAIMAIIDAMVAAELHAWSYRNDRGWRGRLARWIETRNLTVLTYDCNGA